MDVIGNYDDELESYEKITQLLIGHPEINALFFAASGDYGRCRSVTALGLKNRIRIHFDIVPTTKELVEKGVNPVFLFIMTIGKMILLSYVIFI